MLQRLLRERFQLEAHWQAKDVPVYELRVAKGGPKMTAVLEEQDSAAAAGAFAARIKKERGRDGLPDLPPAVLAGGALQVFSGKQATLLVERQSMARLGDLLSTRAGRPVFDETGLPGKYSFTLHWSDDLESGLPISTAFQEQLGLRLESSRRTINVLIVDAANRTPTEN